MRQWIGLDGRDAHPSRMFTSGDPCDDRVRKQNHTRIQSSVFVMKAEITKAGDELEELPFRMAAPSVKRTKQDAYPEDEPFGDL